MITFRDSHFDILCAELVVLDRGGAITWGIHIKGLPSPTCDLKAPQFTLCGVPFPVAGLDALIGKELSLPQGEPEDTDQPQALVYVWDWSAANHNSILIERHSPETVLVSWSGSCDDPEFYDFRGNAGAFSINCICSIRYQT
ncbi:hypothetical protein GCM10027430_29370 [Lysobacter tyrosinilyticus]